MKTITSDSTKSAKSIAQKLAAQLAREPYEVLKEGRKQIMGSDEELSESSGGGLKSVQSPQKTEELKKIDQLKSQRRLSAFQEELKDIRSQRVFYEIQEKISQGQDVNLSNVSELTLAQKQVLNAQKKAVKLRIASESQNEKPLVQPNTKPSRRLLGMGRREQAKREQTKVERPIPPSG